MYCIVLYCIVLYVVDHFLQEMIEYVHFAHALQNTEYKYIEIYLLGTKYNTEYKKKVQKSTKSTKKSTKNWFFRFFDQNISGIFKCLDLEVLVEILWVCDKILKALSRAGFSGSFRILKIAKMAKNGPKMSKNGLKMVKKWPKMTKGLIKCIQNVLFF